MKKSREYCEGTKQKHILEVKRHTYDGYDFKEISCKRPFCNFKEIVNLNSQGK